MKYIIKHFTIFLFALLFAFVGCKTSKETVAEVPGQTIDESKPLEKALLWKIEGKKVKRPSYLYGTIHIIPGEDYFLPAGTQTALSNASNVYFEVDMDDMMNLGKQIKLLTKAFMKDGIRIRDLLTSEEYQLVKQKFEGLGLPFAMFEKIKPMFLSMFIQGDMSPGDIQDGTITSYEMKFWETAKENEIPVEGLETLEFQMSIFDSIPYTEQAKMLVETVKTSDVGNEEFQAMIDIYRAQDIDGMYHMFSSGEEELGAYEDLFLTTRNKNWVPVMESVLLDGNVFFAVGAGHLGGPNGMIRLLRKAGYTLTPVLSEVLPSRKTKKI
jgi:uncharacterized protein YbaP (TraB family)